MIAERVAYEKGKNGKFACPLCLNFTLSEIGQYDICAVCFWEDDGVTDLDEYSGPNPITLREGRSNFASFGACDGAMQVHVRKAKKSETVAAAIRSMGDAK